MDGMKGSPAQGGHLRGAMLRRYGVVREHCLSLKRRLKPFYWRIPMSLNGGMVSVELHADGVGLFATLTQVLYLLIYCDQRGYTPRIHLTGSTYVNPKVGPDWFDYFFEYQPPFARLTPIYTLYVNNLDELGIGTFLLPTFNELGTTLTEAHRVFFKYLRIKTSLEEAVETFWRAHFAGYRVLGVHYRGTDKNTEAPRVSWESCLQAVSDFLAGNTRIDTVFLATDEQGFVDYLKRGLPEVRVVVHDDAYRSSGRDPVHSHLFIGDNYQKGRDAMMNALLLSRCSALLRTTSALSGWASIFNPQLPVTMLNRPFGHTSWFPDTEIVKYARTYQPLPSGEEGEAGIAS